MTFLPSGVFVVAGFHEQAKETRISRNEHTSVHQPDNMQGMHKLCPFDQLGVARWSGVCAGTQDQSGGGGSGGSAGQDAGAEAVPSLKIIL